MNIIMPPWPVVKRVILGYLLGNTGSIWDITAGARSRETETAEQQTGGKGDKGKTA
jgi:hypothetical protein